MQYPLNKHTIIQIHFCILQKQEEAYFSPNLKVCELNLHKNYTTLHILLNLQRMLKHKIL